MIVSACSLPTLRSKVMAIRKAVLNDIHLSLALCIGANDSNMSYVRKIFRFHIGVDLGGVILLEPSRTLNYWECEKTVSP